MVSGKKTYKAFTLVEMLVAMVISIIVIGLAYTAFLFLSQRFVQQKNTTEELTDIYRLKDLLLQDYKRAHFADFENQELHLNQMGTVILYESNTDLGYVTRQTEARTDTFFVSNRGFEEIEGYNPIQVNSKVLKLRFGSREIPVLIEQKQSVMQKIRAKYED